MTVYVCVGGNEWEYSLPVIAFRDEALAKKYCSDAESADANSSWSVAAVVVKDAS